MPLDSKGIAGIISGSSNVPFTGVVMIRRGETLLFGEGYGYANRAERLPNTLNTRFGVASGSKAFTAVAICKLVEQGRLRFDALLRDIIPDPFPLFDPGVTVHHLLTHTSGIPDYFDEEVMDDFAALWEARPVYALHGPRDLLPLFGDLPMKFAPGERFSYNNGGYVLLGLIIEAVTGVSFREHVAECVLNPAGMKDSGFFRTDALPERTASGYIEQEDGGWRTNAFAIPYIGLPDGGAYTTAPDVARFWDALMCNILLSPETTSEMLSLKAIEDEDQGYGYGIWLRRSSDGAPAPYLMGEDPGVSFFSRLYPRDRLLLTVIGNTDSAAWPVARALDEFIRRSDGTTPESTEVP